MKIFERLVAMIAVGAIVGVPVTATAKDVELGSFSFAVPDTWSTTVKKDVVFSTGADAPFQSPFLMVQVCIPVREDEECGPTLAALKCKSSPPEKRMLSSGVSERRWICAATQKSDVTTAGKCLFQYKGSFIEATYLGGPTDEEARHFLDRLAESLRSNN